jgi:hypothetical protein
MKTTSGRAQNGLRANRLALQKQNTLAKNVHFDLDVHPGSSVSFTGLNVLHVEVVSIEATLLLARV